MIPVGYMAKQVITRPEWIKNPDVTDIYSVSSCISDNFADYINYWKHNGYWLFDEPDIIRQLAKEASIDLSAMQFFYYEVYELQFDEEKAQWLSFKADESFLTDVLAPETMTLEGYDVVSFMARTSRECSPLSCNSLARSIQTNSHCLLSSFEDAKRHIETGSFNNSEPGPYRIFAVYTLGRKTPSS